MELVFSTFLYLSFVFIRELFPWITGKSFDEILTSRSYHALFFFASLLYLIFVLSWGGLVIRSYKRWGKENVNGKM